MPGKNNAGSQWLDSSQAHVWLTFMQIQLRLNYEMHRQLQDESGLSLADYHVLSAISVAPGHRLQLSELATYVGWELSRAGHHIRRMAARGLVRRTPSETDGRATDVEITEAGMKAILDAAPRHVALVRRLFFDGLPKHLEGSLREALDGIYDAVIRSGTLPPPPERR
jgi:DNA-binding MarR family transcriptional regulator